MPCCYILYSQKLTRFYVGVSTNLEERLKKHNNHTYGAHRFTAKASDWEIFLSIELVDYSHAVRLERKIKLQKSAKYIRNLKQYPELVEKIISETSKS
jgi:putative endonuclease